MDVETASPRQKKATETKGRLFAAAIELFGSQGFQETTIDQIAKKAGVAKGTFFLYFASKSAVVVQVIRLQAVATAGAREAALPRGPVAALRASLMALGEQAAWNRGLSRAVAAAGLENTAISVEIDAILQQTYADIVADCEAARVAGELTRDVDAETIASVVFASYLGATLYFTMAPKPKPMLKLLATLIDSNLAGFGFKS